MNTKTCIILFIYFSSLASCSIEKRHYIKGFYVDWIIGKHKLPEIQNQLRSLEEIDTNQIISASLHRDLEKNDVENISKPFISRKNSYQYHAVASQADTPIHPIKIKQFDIQSKTFKDSDYTGRVLNGWALAGFIALLISIFFLFIIGLWVIALLIFVVIASLIGLAQTYNTPFKYSGRTLATVSLIISGIYLLLLFILLHNGYGD